jgi:spermidine synthase
MWVHELTDKSITKTINIKNVKSYSDNIKVLEDNNSKKILTINENIIFDNNDYVNYSESIVHTALCSHPEASNILVLGYDTLSIDKILKHNDVKNITVICDENIKNAIEENFYKLTVNTKIKILKDIKDSDSDVKYDVIINTSVNITPLSYATIIKYSKKDTIFVSYSKNHKSQIKEQILEMKDIGAFYKIVMPFSFEMNLCADGVSCCIFASNKYHPCADIILHKSDLLEDLEYYNSELHQSSFIFSTNINKEYKNIIKK